LSHGVIVNLNLSTASRAVDEWRGQTTRSGFSARRGGFLL